MGSEAAAVSMKLREMRRKRDVLSRKRVKHCLSVLGVDFISLLHLSLYLSVGRLKSAGGCLPIYILFALRTSLLPNIKPLPRECGR
jgi:hypothetical protein